MKILHLSACLYLCNWVLFVTYYYSFHNTSFALLVLNNCYLYIGLAFFLLSGVSNCYVFKSRLQEYAQKYKLPTPIYETVKEGPSHKSLFQSTVIVDGVRYDSLPGFFNRKAAEQSAAEVALQELSKSTELGQCVSLPVVRTSSFLYCWFKSSVSGLVVSCSFASSATDLAVSFCMLCAFG